MKCTYMYIMCSDILEVEPILWNEKASFSSLYTLPVLIRHITALFQYSSISPQVSHAKKKKYWHKFWWPLDSSTMYMYLRNLSFYFLSICTDCSVKAFITSHALLTNEITWKNQWKSIVQNKAVIIMILQQRTPHFLAKNHGVI